MDRDRAIDVLVRFARLVSDSAAFGEILPILADAIRENVQADGVCVVEISAQGGARVVVARGLPPGAHELELVLDPDAMGEELGRAISDACGNAFVHAVTRCGFRPS